MMQNKIFLKIQESLVQNSEQRKIVIYKKNKILLSLDFILSIQENITNNEFDINTSLRMADKFNVWIFLNDEWKIVFSGIPQIVIDVNGNEIIELNNSPKVIINNKNIKKIAEITQYDADFANKILGDNVISPYKLSENNKIQNLYFDEKEWQKSGFDVSTEKTLKNRIDICKSCEFFDPNAFCKTGMCLKCSCSIYFMAMIPSSVCPLNPSKWNFEVSKKDI